MYRADCQSFTAAIYRHFAGYDGEDGEAAYDPAIRRRAQRGCKWATLAVCFNVKKAVSSVCSAMSSACSSCSCISPSVTCCSPDAGCDEDLEGGLDTCADSAKVHDVVLHVQNDLQDDNERGDLKDWIQASVEPETD